MPRAAIAAHLAKLLEAEKIVYDPAALPLIGRAAAGSMRDALSLLDQAIAHGAGRISSDDVRDMLGAVDETYLLRLLEAVGAGDAHAALAIADEMAARSLSFDQALADLASLLLRVALAQSVPEALEDDLPERERIVALGERLDAETVQLDYQIALQGRDDLALAPDEHAGFVMSVLRMLAFRPEGGSERSALGESAARTAPPARAQAVATPLGTEWTQLVGKLQVTGAARELARNAELARRDGNSFELLVPKSKAYLAEKSYQDKLKAALEQLLGTGVSVKVVAGEARGGSIAALEATERGARQVEATRAVQGDRFVQDLMEICDAKVIASTIQATPKNS
jgi:DNA polymerase-3 subunit gamma/tau